MCGICAWIDTRFHVRPRRLAAAIELLRHRGPDNRQVYLHDGREGRRYDAASSLPDRECLAGLAHSRLSIIDLDEGANQPMISEDGKRILVYNGEAYNYLELRAELETAGETFRTSSDTEVVLRLLEREGVDAMRKVNGMWALALLDMEKRVLTLSRDRFGKKPLFYHLGADGLVAASEFKSIFEIIGGPRKVNPAYLTAFLCGKRYPTLVDGETFYRDIREVPQGGYLTYDLDRKVCETGKNNAIEEWFDKPADMGILGSTIEDSVKLRLRSDVPVAVMVSGGVDSSLVAAHVAADPEAKRNTAFYTFPTDSDDIDHSRVLAKALGIDLVEVDGTMNAELADQYINDIVRSFEIPVNLKIVALPGYLMCRKMAADGIRVVLDGTGGDELLGGYPGFYTAALQNLRQRRMFFEALRMKLVVDKWERFDLSKGVRKWRQFFTRMVFPKRNWPEPTPMARARLLGRHGRVIGEEQALGLVHACFEREIMTSVTEMQRFELTRGLIPHYLFMTDQISMINSLETRSPLLDYRLAPYVDMPLRERFHAGFNKYRLRELLPPCVPDSIRWRQAKAGFAFSPEQYVKQTTVETVKAVRRSPLLNEMYDVPRVVDDWERNSGDGQLKTLVNHMYSVCALESVYELQL